MLIGYYQEKHFQSLEVIPGNAVPCCKIEEVVEVVEVVEQEVEEEVVLVEAEEHSVTGAIVLTYSKLKV